MFTFIQIIFIGATLLGAVAGVVGTWSVLRRRALVADLVSHAALPGLCVAFWFAGEKNYSLLVIGAFVSGVFGVAVVSFLTKYSRTKEDSAIGIVLSCFYGLGIVMLSILQRDKTHSGKISGLERFTIGQVALLTDSEVALIAAVGALVLVIILSYYKEFKLLSFDPGFAQALGWPVFWLDLLMMGCISAVAVVGIKAVGVLLTPALLIIPAAIARYWTDRLGMMLILAGVFGGIAGAVGTLMTIGIPVSENWNWALGWITTLSKLPTGPMIVILLSGFFLVSITIAPRYGWLSQLRTRLSFQSTIARENLLRALYEATEEALPQLADVPLQSLAQNAGWKSNTIRDAARRNEILLRDGSIRLTKTGLDHAIRITRTHRLWELFLIQGVDIAQDHVDRDADSVEHLLPPELVDQLEQDLIKAGRWPQSNSAVPKSPHDLTGSHIGGPVDTSQQQGASR